MAALVIDEVTLNVQVGIKTFFPDFDFSPYPGVLYYGAAYLNGDINELVFRKIVGSGGIKVTYTDDHTYDYEIPEGQSYINGPSIDANQNITFDIPFDLISTDDYKYQSKSGNPNGYAIVDETQPYIVGQNNELLGSTFTTQRSGEYTIDLGFEFKSFSLVPLPEGDQSYDISATAAGQTITIDAHAPPPTIQLQNDTGSSSSDKLTQDASLRGTAEPGDPLIISEGGVTLGTTTANGVGVWQLPLTLTDGDHVLTVTQTDNLQMQTTDTVSFTVDTTPQTSAFICKTTQGISRPIKLPAKQTWLVSRNRPGPALAS